MSDTGELVVSNDPAGKLSETALAQELGALFGMPGQSIINLVRSQIIAVPENHPPATAAELAFVMTVMRQYGLNPMLKQIHAWRDNKGKLNTMVGYDGWVDYSRRQKSFQFVSYEFGPVVESPDKKGKKCWEWIKPIIHDRDFGAIEMTPVYLEEWYVPQRGNYPEPWQKQTKHRLHLKAFTSAIREFYGMGGVMDEVDRDVVREEYHRAEFATSDKVQEMASRMAGDVLPMSTQPIGEGVVPGPDSFPEVSGIDDPILRESIINAVKESVAAPPVLETQPCADCTAPTSVKCLGCGAYVCAMCMAEDGSQCAACAAKEVK